MKEKNLVCVSSKKINDNNKPAHLVGHYKVLSLYINDLL